MTCICGNDKWRASYGRNRKPRHKCTKCGANKPPKKVRP